MAQPLAFSASPRLLALGLSGERSARR